ncbi:MAG: VWA domain-containing protein [Acidobacteria bacterium]|nr:VWA domain-containing protein [Acidobacteriota bacterium]
MSRSLQMLALISITLGMSSQAAEAPKNPPEARTPRFREYVTVMERAYQRVGLTVTVTDRAGLPVRGLGRDDFRLLEDGVEVAIEDFGVEGDNADRPLSVAVLLDLSQSMGGQVRRVREAAQALLAALRQQDEIMVARFNHERTVLQPFTRDPRDPEVTLQDIGTAWGGTNIFQAIEQTLKDLRLRPGRKVILVVTDGLDNYVGRSNGIFQSLYLRDLLHLCLRTQTVVYGIRPGMVSGWPPFERFVDETGGRLLYTGRDLGWLFKQLGEEFLSQYYLAYDIDPNVKQGKRRRIRVEVSRPEITVKTMAGFFTPRSQLETLVRDLRDKDAELRTDAAYELGFVQEPRSSEALQEALEDKEEEVREMAIGALSRLGEVGASPILVRLLGDPSASVREAAADALRGFGPAAIPHLVAQVSRGAEQSRARPASVNAAKVLGTVGDDRASEPLALLLKNGPVESRAAAAEALGNLGLSRGIGPLRAALLDPAPDVRGAALRSLAALAGNMARPVIEDYIRKETDPGLRESAQALLASL